MAKPIPYSSDPQIVPFAKFPPEIRNSIYEQALPQAPASIFLMRAMIGPSGPKIDRARQTDIVTERNLDEGTEFEEDEAAEDEGPRDLAVIGLYPNARTTPEGWRAHEQIHNALNLMRSCRWVYKEFSGLFFAKFQPTTTLKTMELFVDTYGPAACPLKHVSIQFIQYQSIKRIIRFIQSMPALESLGVDLEPIQTARLERGAVLRARATLRKLARILAACPKLAKVLAVPTGGEYVFKVVRITTAELPHGKGEIELNPVRLLKILQPIP